MAANGESVAALGMIGGHCTLPGLELNETWGTRILAGLEKNEYLRQAQGYSAYLRSG